MQRIISIFIMCLVTLLLQAYTTPEKHVIGKAVHSFTLRNIDNKKVSLDNYKNVKGFVIVFTCNHCPYARLYTKRLNALNAAYAPKGVSLLAINSMDSCLYETETFRLMAAHATAQQYNFPYLQDDRQVVVKDFKAGHTPQAYVIWKEAGKWVIKYSGAIDDNAGDAATATPFIANAIDELLKGQSVSRPETQSVGCAIYYRQQKSK